MKNKVLLILKTPPPFGGGEHRAAALRDYVSTDPLFKVLEISSNRRNKSNHGVFSLWKVWEFIIVWCTLIALILKDRPALLFLPLSKGFVPFLRDSILVWTAKLFRVAVCSELPGATYYFLGKGKWRTRYGQFVLRSLACLRLQGRNVANTLGSFGIKNTIVTDNGIQSLSKNKYQKTPPNGRPRILFVGTHSSDKGFDVLVDACLRLLQSELSFEVHSMGEWISEEFERRIVSAIESAGFQDHFFLHGLTRGEKKWVQYDSCQIFSLPSRREGQPLVVLEALSSGLPIVATNVGAIPDTVEDGKNGFLVEPRNVDQVADQLEKLLVDADLRLRMSKANRMLYEQRFTETVFLRTQTAWLQDCAEGRLDANGQRFTLSNAIV